MPVSYSNTIALLLGILPSHQQCDCPCCHCACLCHQRKSTTESYTAKKDYPGGTALVPQNGGVAASACGKVSQKKMQEKTWQCKQLAHKRLIQDAIVQPLTSLTNLEEEGRANLKKRTAKKRSSTTPQETQNLQNTHASTKSRRRELRLESVNSPYR